MTATVQKWGNSLAVRVPKSIARELRISHGEEMELKVGGGKLVMRPTRRKVYKLEDLVAGITRKNRHKEMLTGPPRGREIW